MKITRSISIEYELWLALKEQAEQDRTTVSALVDTAIRRQVAAVAAMAEDRKPFHTLSDVVPATSGNIGVSRPAPKPGAKR